VVLEQLPQQFTAPAGQLLLQRGVVQCGGVLPATDLQEAGETCPAGGECPGGGFGVRHGEAPRAFHRPTVHTL